MASRILHIYEEGGVEEALAEENYHVLQPQKRNLMPRGDFPLLYSNQ